MSDIHGILLTEKEEMVTVMTPQFTVNIMIDWERREISEISHKRNLKPVAERDAEELKEATRKLAEYKQEDFPELILTEELDLRAEPTPARMRLDKLRDAARGRREEADEADFRYDNSLNSGTEEEKIIMAPFQPMGRDIVLAEPEPVPEKKKKKRTHYIDRGPVKEAILAYGRKREGKFTFRIHSHPDGTSNEEACREAINIQKETGFGTALLKETIKTLLNEGSLTRGRGSSKTPFIYEIRDQKSLLKKEPAPDVAGGLK